MELWRIILGIVGGMFIHLVGFTQVIGTVYISGNINVYMVSYLRAHGADVTLGDAVIILPLQIITSTCALFVGARMTHRLGTRVTTLIGNSVAVLATFLGSFCTAFWSYCLVYAIGFGIGDGLSVSSIQYMAPLIMGWSYYPKHKGRITGLILTFFGVASCIFSLVSTAIINPDNKSATIKVKNGASTDKYYTADVADGFPAMMRWLALCYLCLSVVGVVLIIPVKESKQQVQSETYSEDHVALPSVTAALKHFKFWQLFGMSLLSSSTRYLRLWPIPRSRL